MRKSKLYLFQIAFILVFGLNRKGRVENEGGDEGEDAVDISDKPVHWLDLVTRIKNPAYGRHQLSEPMRIVVSNFFWRSCEIFF